MTRLRKPSTRRLRHAFTLVEMLIMVAAIAVLSSVALVAYNGHLHEAVTETHDRRNAQEIAAECQRAAAAGVDILQGGGLEDAILNLIDGLIATDGAFKERAFKVILPTKEDYHAAMAYLELRDGAVVYLPE